jgi:hypothetical protein
MDLDHTSLFDDADADDYNQALQDVEKIAKNVEDVIVMFANALQCLVNALRHRRPLARTAPKFSRKS